MIDEEQHVAPEQDAPAQPDAIEPCGFYRGSRQFDVWPACENCGFKRSAHDLAQGTG